MNRETALQAMSTGQTVRVTDRYGKIFEGTIDAEWQMAKGAYGPWDRYPVGSNLEGCQLGSVLYQVRFSVEGPGVPAGLTSSVDATLEELELV